MTLSGWNTVGSSDGLTEGPREGGLRRYLRVLREHWLLVVAAVLVSMLAAFAYAASADKTYEAEAVLEITPVPDDGRFDGIAVVRESSDPTRDVETLALFAGTQGVEDRARQFFAESDPPPGAVLGDIEALPKANSFLVGLTATANDPDLAARTANAYSLAIVALRNQAFNRDLRRQTTNLRAQLNTLTPTPTGDDARSAVQTRLANLSALRGTGDPSISELTPAFPPEAPSSPGLPLILIAGAFVGLFWGVGAAFVSDTLLSRLRRDRQLLESFTLPIVARIPTTRGRYAGVSPLSPAQLDAPSLEGYRTLRQNIEVLRRDGDVARTIMFTSAAPSEGKTTSAVNTAATLAQSGYRVVLVDADLRRPSVGKTLSMAPAAGTAAVLSGLATLDEALVSTSRYGAAMELLLVNPSERPRVELLTKVAIDRLIAAARERADFIIFDTAPLATVADALPIATAVDDVFITVRRGQTKMATLRRLVETLGMHNVIMRGFVLIGVARERVSYGSLYYQVDEGPSAQAPAPRQSVRRGG